MFKKLLHISIGHSAKTTLAGYGAAAVNFLNDPSIRSALVSLFIALLGRLTQDSQGATGAALVAQDAVEKVGS